MLSDLVLVETDADLAGGLPGNDRIRRYVAGHDRTGGDDGASTDARARQDDGAEPDPHIFANVDGQPGAGAGVVVVADPRRLPDGSSKGPVIVVVPADETDVVREHGVVADRTVDLDSAVLADVDVIADREGVGGGDGAADADVQIHADLYVRPDAVVPIGRLQGSL